MCINLNTNQTSCLVTARIPFVTTKNDATLTDGIGLGNSNSQCFSPTHPPFLINNVCWSQEYQRSGQRAHFFPTVVHCGRIWRLGSHVGRAAPKARPTLFGDGPLPGEREYLAHLNTSSHVRQGQPIAGNHVRIWNCHLWVPFPRERVSQQKVSILKQTNK